MTFPATCIKDAALYAQLIGPRGLIAPIDIKTPPIDMPHGAFGKLVRDHVDPLWGARDLAPEEWDELEDLLIAEGEPSLRVFEHAWPGACRAREIFNHAKVRGARSDMAFVLGEIRLDYDPDERGEDPPVTTKAPGRPLADAAALPPNVTPIHKPATAAPVKPKDTRMQFTSDKGPLLAALKKSAGLVPKKTTMPILSCVLLDVRDALTISGTDLSIEVQVKMPVSIGATPGKVAVAGAALVSAIDALPDGAQVTLERTEDGRLRILSGRTRFHLPIRQPDEFPAFAAADGAEIRAQAQEWRRAIDRVAYAMSTDDVTRASICGMFLHARQEGLRVVGTNGNVLSRSDLNVTAPATDFVAAHAGGGSAPGVLIPRESVNILRRLLETVDGETEVLATVSRKRAVFEMWPVRFATALATAEFPPYERIVAGQQPKIGRKLSVPRAELLATVRRVRAVAGDKNRAVALTITAEGIRVSTVVTAGDSGADAVDIMEVPTGYAGGTLDIGFASGLLLSSIESLTASDLLCDLGGPSDATMWRAAQEPSIDEAEHFVLVLPYRLNAPAPAGGA